MESMFYMLTDGGPPVVAVLLLGLLGGLTGSVTGLLLWLRRRVPPAVALAPLGLIPLVVVVGQLAGNAAAQQAIATAPPEMKQVMLAGSISMNLYGTTAAGMVLPLVAIPVCWLAAGASLRQEKRSWAWGGIAAAVVLLCAVIPLFGVSINGSLGAAASRATMAVFLGLPTAFALTGGDWSGRLAGVLATCAFAVAIIGGAAVEVGLGASEAFRAVAVAPPEMKQVLLDDALGIVTGVRDLALLPALASLGLALAAAARVKEGRDRPGTNFALAAAWLTLLLLVLDPASSLHRMGL